MTLNVRVKRNLKNEMQKLSLVLCANEKHILRNHIFSAADVWTVGLLVQIKEAVTAHAGGFRVNHGRDKRWMRQGGRMCVTSGRACSAVALAPSQTKTDLSQKSPLLAPSISPHLDSHM